MGEHKKSVPTAVSLDYIHATGTRATMHISADNFWCLEPFFMKTDFSLFHCYHIIQQKPSILGELFETVGS